MTLTRKKELGRGTSVLKRTELKSVSPKKLVAGLRLPSSTFKAKPKAERPAVEKPSLPRAPWVQAPAVTAEAVRKAKAVAKRKGPTPATVALVIERDGSACIICGIGLLCIPELRGITHHVHHLQYRSRGGHHRASNLALLCPICHKRVHCGDQDEAEAKGWSTVAGGKPGRKVEILTPDGQRWARFHDNGTRTILKTRVRAGAST